MVSTTLRGEVRTWQSLESLFDFLVENCPNYLEKTGGIEVIFPKKVERTQVETEHPCHNVDVPDGEYELSAEDVRRLKLTSKDDQADEIAELGLDGE